MYEIFLRSPNKDVLKCAQWTEMRAIYSSDQRRRDQHNRQSDKRNPSRPDRLDDGRAGLNGQDCGNEKQRDDVAKIQKENCGEND
jgi:hypothetical protein